MVLDNTNVTRAERAGFIDLAKEAGYFVRGFFFQSRRAEAIARNAQRPVRQRVPDAAVGGKSAELELPQLDEGFDELSFVRIGDGRFVVEDWRP